MIKKIINDCIFVKTIKNNKWVFIINDIIAYEGKKIDNLILPERLKIIYNLLNDKYTPDIVCDVCTYKIKSYYYVSKKSLQELINKSKELDYTCRGVYFYSYYLKHKPKLYNFDENVIISVQKKIKDITEFKTQPTITTITTPLITSNIQELLPTEKQEEMNEKYRNLWVAKTDDADIYYLYDNYNILTSKKIGIALIPTLKDSIRLRNYFKDKNLTYTIKYKCIFNDKFNKYQPIEQII